MRSRSKKQDGQYRKHKEMREGFIADARWCAACGATTGLACHEITNGPDRMAGFGRREALLVLCWDCNSQEFTDKAKWPIARQLALKLLVDPEHFDLDTIDQIRSRFVDRDEVLKHAAKLLMQKGAWG